MPYVINRWAGQPIVTVEDGTVTQTLDVKLIGKNYAGYGEIQNENFVHLLENFAGAQSPVNAISGQIWYDTTNKQLKFHTGEQVAGVKLWKTAGGVEYGPEPATASPGDMWYDVNSGQLKIRRTNAWAVIGPQAAGSGVTQMRSRLILGRAPGVGSSQPATNFSIIEATSGDSVVFVISSNEFTIAPAGTGPGGVNDPDNVISGFTIIKKGITLANINPSTGAPTNPTLADQTLVWGTSVLSRGLLVNSTVVEAEKVVTVENPDFKLSNFRTTFNDLGLTVGDADDLRISVTAQDDHPVIENLTGNALSFKVSSGTSSIKLEDKNLLPGANNQYNLGSSTLRWANIHATTFTGRATSAAALFYSGAPNAQNNLVVATESDTAWSVPIRDGNKAITATLFSGDALRARYADLAEKYLADAEYEPGTVVCIGGSAEVTASSLNNRAVGVVSTNPAFMMNTDLEGGTYVALKGRVPTKVIGSVKKGDRLVAADNGHAKTALSHEFANTFAVALEDSTEVGSKIVECLVL
jgi:hypothetical protein